MRRLSARQAVTCENATGKRCKCRCGGLLHGRGRVADAEEAAQLPQADPHYAQVARRRKPVRRELPGQLELDLRPLVVPADEGRVC